MASFIHITIDGPVGSGKTTVARELARRLGILYLDTGAMYRAVAFAALQAGIDPADEEAVVALARTHTVHVTLDETTHLGFRVFVGERELEKELHENAVSTAAALVATHLGVREELVARQREIAAEAPVVMAGRDIGTVVLPDAPLKIFLTASVEARVERRLAELSERGEVMDREVLSRDIAERDRRDAARPIAPLRAAEDAITIDSSEMDAEQVVERIQALAAELARAHA